MRPSYAFMLLAGLLPAPSAPAGTVPDLQRTLVKDILGPQPMRQGSSPQHFRTIGPHVYFQANAPATGIELYRTDGTAGGLELVADINPGAGMSSPYVIGAAGQKAIVLAGSSSGQQFWSVSASEPLQQLTNINWPTPPLSGAVFEVAQVGSRLLWTSASPGPLWSSDGSAAGTGPVALPAQFPPVRQGCSLPNAAVLAAETAAGVALASSDGLTATFIAEAAGARQGPEYFNTLARFRLELDSVCYFLWERQSGGWTLWRSDGTSAGTHEFAGSATGIPLGVQTLNQQLYIFDRVGNQVRLQRSSAAQPQPQLVSNSPVTNGFDSPMPARVGNYLVFMAREAISGGLLLFRTDGTAGGTQPVLSTPIGGSFHVLGQKVFVDLGNAWNAVDVSNGATTPIGPFLPKMSAALGNVLIGQGEDGYGTEVWISDGTASGTRRLHDVWPDNPDGLSALRLRRNSQALGNRLYFVANEPPGGPLSAVGGLWRTDGTDAGTQPLPRSLYNNRLASGPQALGDDLLFQTSGNFADPIEVFRVNSDFSAVTLLRSGNVSAYMQPIGNGETVVFSCGVGGAFCVMRESDTAMTVLNNGPAAPNNVPIGSIGNVAIFATPTNELWRSDATAPGTFRLNTHRKVEEDSRYASTVFNGKLYFASCTSSSNTECGLNFTDGTVAGTGYVRPLPVGVTAAAVNLGNRMLFALTGPGNTPVQLWSSDGSDSGTQMLWSETNFYWPELVVVDGYAHLNPACHTCATPHLVSDGSVAGTHGLPMPATHVPAAGFLAALQNQVVVFRCSSAASGTELCATDPAGTAVATVPDIAPYDASSWPMVLGQVGGTVYFGASDRRHGFELWQMRIWTDALFADSFQ
ncbi:ELWxxDGT repeat protein [Tahibacter aquaticus]|uniref:ELWxxDGT repeat protein n=1 Tax=Tahibacter aquaticus TaxID=520092 RepID=A0A4R6YY12_9GAMM|nr:hypothetical protein [Tahibacter aquaticus]TDR43894.1 ELWxxDGT repeat protein [Tahibacter aquaticus]